MSQDNRDASVGDEGPRPLAQDDPLAVELTLAVKFGGLEDLRRLLESRPEAATARVRARRRGTWRTALHLVTDWPGYLPEGPEMARLLISQGADPSARSAAGPSETPLHWTASNDDTEVALVLLASGADLEAGGGSIAGGSPLTNAVGYGCWNVARLLLSHGARVGSLWEAAGLGLTERVAELLSAQPEVDQEQLDAAFWQACHGGQLRMAKELLERGANVNGRPDYSGGASPLDIAKSPDTRRSLLAGWLGEQGAEAGPGAG